MTENKTYTLKQLRPETSAALEKAGFRELSEIQKLCIPAALDQKDIYAVAPTGTGKTIAFLAPVLEQLEPQGTGKHLPLALILSPTRELASQIADTARKLLAGREGIRTALLCGGTDMNSQVRAFKNGADIVVGTPSRICDHLRRHTLKTSQLHTLILDEADEMLSMGFREDVIKIASQLEEHQTMMFSASENEETLKLKDALLKEPEIFRIEADRMLAHRLRMFHVFCEQKNKAAALLEILDGNQADRILIFINTRSECDRICSLLQKSHYRCDTIHSEMDPNVRKNIMKSFRTGSLKILIATDVAARGLDITDVSLVINYDWPQQEALFIHRIGRTGRSNTEGTIITFLSEKQKDRLSVTEQISGVKSVRIPFKEPELSRRRHR